MQAVACGAALALLVLYLPGRPATAAGPAPAVDPDRLMPLLRDDDFRARQSTLDALAGDSSAAYAADLITDLKHPNPAVRKAVAWGLCRVGADRDLVVAALREALKDEFASEEAARSLEQLRGMK